jgi:phage shock protein PspC (stress-responsive transcriptional regulator)
MQTQNLFTRDDTFFGVCQGVGEDLGVPPNLLRLAFTLFLFFNPVMALASYVGLGLIVLAARLIFREPRPATPEVEAEAEAVAAPAIAEPLPLAA